MSKHHYVGCVSCAVSALMVAGHGDTGHVSKHLLIAATQCPHENGAGGHITSQAAATRKLQREYKSILLNVLFCYSIIYICPHLSVSAQDITKTNKRCEDQIMCCHRFNCFLYNIIYLNRICFISRHTLSTIKRLSCLYSYF